MDLTLFQVFLKRRACLFNILKKQSTRAGKSVHEFIVANEKSYQKLSLPVRFLRTLLTMYSGHSQQLKRSRLPEKFCMAAFLM